MTEEKKKNSRMVDLLKGISCLLLGVGLSVSAIVLGVLMVISSDITSGLAVIIGGVIVIGLALYYSVGVFKKKYERPIETTIPLSEKPKFDLLDPKVIEQITWYGEEAIQKRAEERYKQLTEEQRIEYDAKVALAEESIKFEKKFKSAYIKLGQIHREFGFFDKAFQAFMSGLQVFDNDEEISLELGDLLMAYGDFDGGISVNKKILETDPSSWQAYLQLGICYAQKNELKKAIDFTERATAINQNAPDILNNLGLFYYHDNQIENALRTLKKALSIKPSHQGAIRNYQMIINDKDAIERAGIVLEDLEKEY